MRITFSSSEEETNAFCTLCTRLRQSDSRAFSLDYKRKSAYKANACFRLDKEALDSYDLADILTDVASIVTDLFSIPYRAEEYSMCSICDNIYLILGLNPDIADIPPMIEKIYEITKATMRLERKKSAKK